MTGKNSWLKQQQWRTKTEAWGSVLNDLRHPTPASKYWQAIREQGNFWFLEQMESIDHEVTKIKCAIAVLEARYLRGELKKKTFISLRRMLKAEIKDYEVKRYNLILEDQKRCLAHRRREIQMWQEIIETLETLYPEIDTENPDTHQAESYFLQMLYRWQAIERFEGAPTDDAGRFNVLSQMVTFGRMLHERGRLRPLLLRHGFSEAEIKEFIAEYIESPVGAIEYAGHLPG